MKSKRRTNQSSLAPGQQLEEFEASRLHCFEHVMTGKGRRYHQGSSERNHYQEMSQFAKASSGTQPRSFLLSLSHPLTYASSALSVASSSDSSMTNLASLFNGSDFDDLEISGLVALRRSRVASASVG